MSRPVFPYSSSIKIDKGTPLAVYLQIANSIVELIRNGQLITNTRLPGSRDMAGTIGLHRKTVIAAYNELISQGWAVAKPSKGTYVINKLPIDRPVSIGNPKNIESKKAKIWFKRRNHLVNTDRYYTNHLIVDEGIPDVRLAPVDLINRAYKNVVRHSYQYRHLSYTDPRGDFDLRVQLQSYLQGTRGINVSVNQILITRGSQMGIYLASKTLIEQGDQVVVGDTNYINTDNTLLDAGAQIVRCTVDNDGLDTAVLEKICRSHEVKLVYVTPHHHHPTTATLTAERRLHLLQLAQQYDFTVIEDDYDYDYHFDRSPIMPLASADVQGRVVYLGGISKLVAPAYRIGFMIGPEEYIDAVSQYRRIVDRQGDTLLERAFAHLFKMGDVQRHAKKALQIYRHRWQAFGDSLDCLPDGMLQFKRPSGGMAYWVGLNKVYHWDKLSDKLLQHKVVIPSYSRYDQHKQRHNYIRLGFASLDDNERSVFFKALNEALSEL